MELEEPNWLPGAQNKIIILQLCGGWLPLKRACPRARHDFKPSRQIPRSKERWPRKSPITEQSRSRKRTIARTNPAWATVGDGSSRFGRPAIFPRRAHKNTRNHPPVGRGDWQWHTIPCSRKLCADVGGMTGDMQPSHRPHRVVQDKKFLKFSCNSHVIVAPRRWVRSKLNAAGLWPWNQM